MSSDGKMLDPNRVARNLFRNWILIGAYRGENTGWKNSSSNISNAIFCYHEIETTISLRYVMTANLIFHKVGCPLAINRVKMEKHYLIFL